MNTFDRDEQKIHEAFSNIDVDASNLTEQVKRRLKEETTQAKQQRMRKPLAIVAAASMILVVTAGASALGTFDWFIDKFNPSFSEVIEPVQTYSEDQGIRMEVIGAQKYDNQAIVYLSLQDTSGQNRITEQTSFQDGFSVKMTPPTVETTGSSKKIRSASFSWKQQLLYLDEETNTAYYEFNITGDPDTPLSDPLELGSFLIYFSKTRYDEPVSVSLGSLGKAQTTPIGEDEIWGGMSLPDDRSGITVALTPGRYAALSHGQDDQWVSNMGIVNGKLHVQIAKVFGKEFGSTDVTLALMTPDGSVIEPDYKLTLQGDENHRLLDSGRAGGYANAAYKYEESIFSVNTDELDGYTLYYSCSVYSGVEGKWKVAAKLSDTSQQMRIVTIDTPVEGHVFEHITLSPLGIQVRGSYQQEYEASEMSLALETTDGVVPLEGGGGSRNPQKQTFSLHWNTETPLDVTTVTAVIINDTRIPFE